MKNVTTGLGLCVLGVGIAAYPVLDHLVPRADAGAPRGAGAIIAAATAQVTPTIVWYGIAHNNRVYASSTEYSREYSILVRAWSDGRIEAAKLCTQRNCGESIGYANWQVVSDPAQGLTYRSDINFDARVDGADLGQLLADWGDAPRQDIRPSDCPLNLINP